MPFSSSATSARGGLNCGWRSMVAVASCVTNSHYALWGRVTGFPHAAERGVCGARPGTMLTLQGCSVHQDETANDGVGSLGSPSCRRVVSDFSMGCDEERSVDAVSINKRLFTAPSSDGGGGGGRGGGGAAAGGGGPRGGEGFR